MKINPYALLMALILACGLWPGASVARQHLRHAVADTLRPDTLPPTPPRNGFTTAPATRPLTREDWFRINQPQPQTLDRQFAPGHSRNKAGKVMMYIALGLEAFITWFCLWVAFAFLGEKSRAGTGVPWDFTGLIHVLGAFFLLFGIAGLVFLILQIRRLIRDRPGRK